MDTYSTVPARVNIVDNPRPGPETKYWWVSSSATVAATTERSFSGQYSHRLTLSTTNAWSEYEASWTWPIPGGAAYDIGKFYGKVRVAGPVPAGWVAYLIVRYTEGGASSESAYMPIDNVTSEFKTIDMEVEVDPARTVHRVAIGIWSNGGAPGSVYVGGFDVSWEQVVDSFVHGSAGPDYFWEGVVNDSKSHRKAFLAKPSYGSGGQITPSVSLAVVNRQNVFLRDITSHFIDGSVTYDLDADQWKGTCNLTLDEPGLVEPLADEYVRITLRVAYADGTVEEEPIGMFTMDPPKERWSAGFDSWAYTGRDLLALLATFMFRGEVIPPDPEDAEEGETTVFIARMIEKGQPYRAALIDILTNPDPKYGVGFSPTQISFPASLNAVAEEDVGWEGGTDALTMISDILQGAGWQKPWVGPNLVITSAPAGVDPATVTPSLVLETGENSPVRWPFEVDPDASAVGNRVRVVSARTVTTRTKRRTTKRNVAVEVMATNEDPAHPISFQRLGRWIDIEDMMVPLVNSVAEAQNLAKQALIDAGNLPIKARITTQAMIRGLNEVYELDLKDAYGEPIESGQGRYWCRGWSISLGSPWEMVHSLSRVLPFGQASFLKDE